MNILWIQSGKIVEVDQKSLKIYLTELLRCLALLFRFANVSECNGLAVVRPRHQRNSTH